MLTSGVKMLFRTAFNTLNNVCVKQYKITA